LKDFILDCAMTMFTLILREARGSIKSPKYKSENPPKATGAGATFFMSGVRSLMYDLAYILVVEKGGDAFECRTDYVRNNGVAMNRILKVQLLYKNTTHRWQRRWNSGQECRTEISAAQR
jgi:hypothetical protein